MSEPNRIQTFYNLVVEVAELLSIADYRSNGTIMVPKDQFGFELCKRIINKGIGMFMEDSPDKGWRWMRRLATVTFAITYTGTATSGSSTTLVDSGIANSYDDDFFNGYTIYVEAGTGVGEYASVTDYTGSSGTFEFTALSGSSTPDSTSEYSIARSADAINGDGSRYKLPANFGGTVDGKLRYTKGSNRSSVVTWCDEAQIRARRAVTLISGYPLLAAIRPYEPTDENLSASRRWEIIFDPRPHAINSVTFPYTLFFDQMLMEMGTTDSGSAITLVDGNRWEADDYFNDWIITVREGTGRGETATVTGYAGSSGTFTFTALSGSSTPDTTTVYTVEPAANLHPAGHQFDDTVKAACLAYAEMDQQDEHIDDHWTKYYHQKALPNAYKTDKRSAPRQLGRMINNTTTLHRGTDRIYPYRSYNNVTTEHDQP
jgi:hypothetical protein